MSATGRGHAPAPGVMPDRRSFLAALSTIGASIGGTTGLGPVRRAPRVEASPSVFYSQPGGEATLVRFVVHDADAPAGRLRVYDEAGRELLGTAGVLGVEGKLYGELWLPLTGETRVASVLEMPGYATPIWTQHRVRPHRRWTMYWLTVADGTALSRQLEALDPLARMVQVGLLRSGRVTTNPLATGRSLSLLDHIPFLRVPAAARRAERRFGVPMSATAVTNSEGLQLTAVAQSLNGVGVAHLVSVGTALDPPFGVLESRDGSRVTIASPLPGADPRRLRFAEGGDTMAQEVERLLTTTPALAAPSYVLPAVLVLATTLDDDWGLMIEAVEEWNGRFAYPRIVIGESREFFGMAASTAPAVSAASSVRVLERPPLVTAELSGAAQDRRIDADRRVQELLAPLNDLLGARGHGVQAFADRLAFPEGTLVFNPAPFGRTDAVRMPDGSLQIITDVPALGYVYVPAGSATPAPPFIEPGDIAVAGRRLTVRVDPDTGALGSVFDREDRVELVRPGGGGLNALPGSRLSGVTRWRMPGVGQLLEVHRIAPGGNAVRTTVRVYDSLPWMEIENASDVAVARRGYVFDLNADGAAVSWETPGGVERLSAPTGRFAHLRWLRVEAGAGWSVLFRGLDTPFAEVESDGRLVSSAPAGVVRYRIGVAPPYALRDEPWLFGWGAEPFIVARVTGGGPHTVPSYDRLLRLDRVGVVVLGLKRAEDGDGAIVYLQELMGLGETVTIQPGLLGFRDARRVDFVERDLGPADSVTDAGAAVPIARYGLAAVRVTGLFLRGA